MLREREPAAVFTGRGWKEGRDVPGGACRLRSILTTYRPRPRRGFQRLFFVIPRVIVGVHVLHNPRPDTVKLNYGFALEPAKMLHPRRPGAVASCGHGFCRVLVEGAA